MNLMDLAVQNIRNNIPMMKLSTTVPACIFDEFSVDVPVEINYSVCERDGKQVPANVSLRIARIHEYDWADVPMAQRIEWAEAMIRNWNQAHNLVLEKVSA